MNKVILMGRVGKDLETIQKGETTITKFSLATNDGTKDKPKTNWHDIVAFGKTGEILAKHVGKGDQLCISGELSYNTVENDNGKRTFTSIILKDFSFISGNKQTTNDTPVTYKAKQSAPAEDDYSSDLPF